jgi:penicillin-binding protein-related factor A (putative recombinase)
MLKEGIDCYVPLVDDFGVDLVIRKKDGSFIEVQIKATSSEIAMGDTAMFAAIRHNQRDNYYFVFYSERLDKTWILSSEEFLQVCSTNKKGKNIGHHSVKFNGCKTNPHSNKKEEYVLDRYEKYLANDFSRFRECNS